MYYVVKLMLYYACLLKTNLITPWLMRLISNKISKVRNNNFLANSKNWAIDDNHNLFLNFTKHNK